MLYQPYYYPPLASWHASHLVTGPSVIIVPVDVDTSGNVRGLFLQSY